MGQASGSGKEEPAPSLEAVNDNVDLLFGEYWEAARVELVNDPIIVISRNLSEGGSFEQKQEGFQVNPVLLKCVYHPAFEKTMKSLMGLLIRQLKSMLQSKMIAMVSRQKFRKALNVANFCIFFTNETLLQTINLLHIRSDLHPETHQLINQYTRDIQEIDHQIMDSLSKDQLAEMAKLFRICMNGMIDLHLKLITRSDFTLKIIDRLNSSIFVLYNKILFSQAPEIRKRECQENSKTIIKIGSYFLGLGLETKTASLFELAVLLLQSQLKSGHQDIKTQKALPSHLFKSLPIVSHNEMIHWLTNTLLFALRYVRHEDSMYSKLNMNRVYAFKLLTTIFQHFQPHDQQITYLLEQICLQTKTFQLERIYVSAMAKMYTKLDCATELIKKYAALADVSYNIKGSKREVKIRPDDVRTELEDDEDSVRKEMLDICNKYTLHVIFHKPSTVYEYSDKALWNMILYQLEDGEEGEDEEDGEDGEEDKREEEKEEKKDFGEEKELEKVERKVELQREDKVEKKVELQKEDNQIEVMELQKQEVRELPNKEEEELLEEEGELQKEEGEQKNQEKQEKEETL